MLGWWWWGLFAGQTTDKRMQEWGRNAVMRCLSTEKFVPFGKELYVGIIAVELAVGRTRA